MAINYEDERLQAVEEEKQEKLTQAEETYGGMIEKAEQVYQEQIDATKQWEEQQEQIQQEQTDFAIQQTEQQKEQAQKDYTKEQSAAWVDYQKEKNAYGANAEQLAAAGLAGSGYSESSQVSMYNTYQARVAAARESITKAITDFDSAIQGAILQNNAALAEIEYQALQQRLTLALEGFQYQNQLVLALEEQKASIEDTSHSRYLEVLEQLNTEEALAIAQAQASGGGSDDYLLQDGTVVEETGVEETGGETFTHSKQAIKNMQVSLGVPQTGVWDEATKQASGAENLEQAWKLWNQGKIGTSYSPVVNGLGASDLSNLASRQSKVVIDDSIPKAISEKELERMLDSGEATITRSGNTLTVSKANPLDKQKNTITGGGIERKSSEYYEEQKKINNFLENMAQAIRDAITRI